VIFLICEHCGDVGEAGSNGVREAIGSTARDVGFSPRMPVIEVTGLCAHCRAAGEA
jgi:Fur family zinc uptake transcriptional regulator